MLRNNQPLVTSELCGMLILLVLVDLNTYSYERSYLERRTEKM